MLKSHTKLQKTFFQRFFVPYYIYIHTYMVGQKWVYSILFSLQLLWMMAILYYIVNIYLWPTLYIHNIHIHKQGKSFLLPSCAKYRIVLFSVYQQFCCCIYIYKKQFTVILFRGTTANISNWSHCSLNFM